MVFFRVGPGLVSISPHSSTNNRRCLGVFWGFFKYL
jgi:hypothetical protein